MLLCMPKFMAWGLWIFRQHSSELYPLPSSKATSTFLGVCYSSISKLLDTIQAVIIMYYALGVLNKRHLFLTVLKVRNSNTQVLTELVPGKSSPLAFRLLSSFSVLTRQRLQALLSLSLLQALILSQVLHLQDLI